jgi:tetratricopeptide (TPR) repeat protein
MMKWIMYLVLAVLVGGSWMMYRNTGKEIEALQQQLYAVDEQGDPEGEGAKLKSDLQGKEGERTIVGILLTFLSAGVLGIFFVVFVLPFFAQRVTHAVYDSGEMMERDVMHDARSFVAQGEYEAAIAAFQQAAAAEPLNRLPWVEIAKIQKDNLGDPAAAIQTIRYALESQAWEVNDAAYFLFRLAELYEEVEGDRTSAVAIMNQVVDQFPGTRHAANANHKLHEWSQQDQEAAENAAASDIAAEEAEYLARMQQQSSDIAAEEAEYLARMQQTAQPTEDPEARV